MTRIKVTIIEDEAVTAKDLEIMLINQGYDITGLFYKAEKAIDFIKANKTDIVLIYVML